MGGCEHCGSMGAQPRTMRVTKGEYRGRELDVALCSECLTEFEDAEDISLVDRAQRV